MNLLTRTENPAFVAPVSTPRTLSSRLAVPIILFGAMLIPAVLSPFFMSESLRLDEAQSLWQTSRDARSVLAIVASDVHVPLYHLTLHFWRAYVGDSIAMARALSLAFFILSIPALYLLGRRAYGMQVGIIAAVLFAISPFMNWYGNEIRMYSMFVFLTILNQYFFLRIFKDERPSDSVWALYTLTAVLGVFTHYFFFLGLLGQVVFYGLRRSLFPPAVFGRFMAAAVVIFVSFAPWVLYVYSIGTAGFQDPNLAAPTAVNLFNAFSQFLFGFQNDGLNTVLLSLWPAVVVLGLFALGRNRRLSRETEFFSITVLVSFIVAFVASFVIAPVFVSRYLSFTIPAFYLVVASMFMSYAPRFRYLAQGGLILLMLATLGIEILNPRAPVKENYAGAVSYLNTHATAQDSIVLSAPFTIYPVEYYYRGPAPISTLPIWNRYEYGPIPDFNAENLPSEVAHVTRNNQRVFLLLSYDQGYGEEIRQYFDSRYERMYEENFSERLDLYVYRLRYNTDRTAILSSLEN